MSQPRATRTIAVLEVSPSAFAEIEAKMKAVGYEHAFHVSAGRPVIDMHGIALAADARASGFGQALAALKRGARVCRAGWNGKGMWLRVPGPYTVRSGPDVAGIHTSLPFIEMRTAQGHFVPWLASQTDLLAEDWIIKEPSNPMDNQTERPAGDVSEVEAYPVKDWFLSPESLERRPAMPEGSKELGDGIWQLPDGRRVQPVRAV